jgi:tetratricopeptide (TPR) repeat protein
MIVPLQESHAESEKMVPIFKAVAEMDFAKAETLIELAENGASEEEREVLNRVKGSIANIVRPKRLNFTAQQTDQEATRKFDSAVSFAKQWRSSHDRQYFVAAVKDLQGVLADKPNHFQAMAELAGLLYTDGAFDASLWWSVKALRTADQIYLGTSEGKLWEASQLNTIAWTSVIIGDFSMGEKFGALAVARIPDDSSFHHTLGAALMGKGKLEEALLRFGMAASYAEKKGNTASLAVALGDRGVCYARQSFVQNDSISSACRKSALNDLQRALQLRPNYYASGHWKEALDIVAQRTVGITNRCSIKLVYWTRWGNGEWKQSDVGPNGKGWRHSTSPTITEKFQIKFQPVPGDEAAPEKVYALNSTLLPKDGQEPIEEYHFDDADSYFVANIRDNDTLTIRSGPGERNAAVASLSKGTAGIKITGPSVQNGLDDWTPVKFGDNKGWTRIKFLKLLRVDLFSSD